MSSTGFIDNGARLGGLPTGSTVAIWTNFDYNVSRTDNTVYFTSVNLYYYYARLSGSITSFNYTTGWDAFVEVPSGASRAGGFFSGTRNVNVQYGPTGGSNFSVGVGAGDTTYTGRMIGRFRNDGYTTGNFTVGIPALGAPSLATQSVTNITPKTATFNSTYDAGANSSGISYIAVQYGLTTSYGQEVYGAAANVTGLKPGTLYHYRFYSENNGGKNALSGDYTFTTKSIAGALPVIMGLLR